MNNLARIAKDIEAFAALHDVPPCRVTRAALNDGSFYNRLKDGSANPRIDTIVRLHTFMASETPDFSCGRARAEEVRRIQLADLPPVPMEPRPVINDLNAEEGSQRLLESVQRLYQRTAERRGCSVEAAQILCNYSPAQIARMAA